MYMTDYNLSIRLANWDLLRSLAMFLVVVVHTSGNLGGGLFTTLMRDMLSVLLRLFAIRCSFCFRAILRLAQLSEASRAITVTRL